MLQHLADKGYKASLKKLQFVQKKVTFLGHEISHASKQLSPKRIETIQAMPRPLTKRQCMSFLGAVGFCRMFIADCSLLMSPLNAIAHDRSLTTMSSKLTWTPDAEKAFTQLKCALSNSPALGLPVADRPFIQFVDAVNCALWHISPASLIRWHRDCHTAYRLLLPVMQR